jgi:5-(carboxyamino)imidazole ribonucleotide synthase
MPANEALPPGSTIGILGGGQLGRMLTLAAARLGLKCHVYSPDPDSPAFAVAAARTVAPYDDAAALAAFARSVEIVTYEFENVDVVAVERLARLVPVRPGVEALAVSQDRLTEKRFLERLNIATAAFAPADDLPSLEAAFGIVGLPAVLKTRRFGYDGKGQAVIRTPAQAGAALAGLGGTAAILESFVPFAREVSVIAARGADGKVAAYDPAENVHRDGILRTSTVPARIAPETAAAATRITGAVLEALAYVGVIGVEFFVVGEGAGERLVVNEMAPRVHNSGHWTIEGALTSQFEQHIRAVAGWPLGPTTRVAEIEMLNLIGEDANAWPALAADPTARLHLYGKRDARSGRKMGHVTKLRF